MKKIIYSTYLIFIFFLISTCSGYKPIFSTQNLQFEISNHYIKGEKMLGNMLYSKLRSVSKSKKKDGNVKSIEIYFDLSKTKSSTSKDSSGKILGYKININAEIEVLDYLTNEKIMDRNFNSSLTYKVQDQYSETMKQEQKTTEDLINEIYQNLLINLSKNLS